MNIVTGDEPWIHHFDPEEKRLSMQYRHTSSPRPKKFKTVPSAGKILLTVFWDSQRVYMTEFLESGNTGNNVNTYSIWPDSKCYTQPLGNVFGLINTQNRRTAFSPIILFCNILRLKMHDSISLLQQSLLNWKHKICSEKSSCTNKKLCLNTNLIKNMSIQ